MPYENLHTLHVTYGKREFILRISFQILLANALLVSQLASASSNNDAQLRSALTRAMKTHDSVMVQAVANSGHESIDNDTALQEQIKSYFANEAAYQEKSKQRAKATAQANKRAQAKRRAQDREAAKAKEIAKAKEAVEAKETTPKKKVVEAKPPSAPVVEQISLERDDDTAQKEAEAQKAEQARQKQQKATQAKLAQEAEAKKVAASKKAQQQAKAEKEAAERKRTKRLAEEEAVRNAALQEKNRKIAASKKARAEKAQKAQDAKLAEKKRLAQEKKVATQKPITISTKKLLGTWKEVNSDKVITLKIAKDGQFSLEQVEEDGTLSIAGTWKSEEDIFMMNIKKVQRNMHTRETDIHRVYKVVTLNKKQFVLHDKRKRIAYDLTR